MKISNQQTVLEVRVYEEIRVVDVVVRVRPKKPTFFVKIYKFCLETYKLSSSLVGFPAVSFARPPTLLSKFQTINNSANFISAFLI